MPSLFTEQAWPELKYQCPRKGYEQEYFSIDTDISGFIMDAALHC